MKSIRWDVKVNGLNQNIWWSRLKVVILCRFKLMAICLCYVPHVCVLVVTSKVVTQNITTATATHTTITTSFFNWKMTSCTISLFIVSYFCLLWHFTHACIYILLIFLASLILSSKDTFYFTPSQRTFLLIHMTTKNKVLFIIYLLKFPKFLWSWG